ncbi:tetratricopeptide repeat protein [Devosia sp. CN2-171]|uniref:tetratricopeptide repeat protein n=1 Tax=Devosia sp. CN2-171 TaxID=3400909 RepID=UPI003BF88D70
MAVSVWRSLARKAIPAVLVLLLAAASGQAALAELGPILRDPQSPQLRQVSLTDGSVSPAYSTASHNTVLRLCLQTITSVHVRMLPTSARTALLDACGDDVQVVLALTPANGFARYMAGFLAVQRGDWEQAIAELKTSFAVAPNEYWLARLRSDLVEDHFDVLGDALATEQTADIAVTLQGEPGRSELAQRYWLDRTSSERIVSIAEGLSPEQQRLFLWAVQRYRPRDAQ